MAFRCLVARESSILAPIAPGDVDPPTLHKMTGEADTCRIGVECTTRELFIEQAEKATESRLVAAVRGRGEQNQMLLAVRCKAPQQFKPLLPALVRAHWTSVFGSERLTGALLDRLTHHVHILEMNGESYRFAQSKRRSRLHETRTRHGDLGSPECSRQRPRPPAVAVAGDARRGLNTTETTPPSIPTNPATAPTFRRCVESWLHSKKEFRLPEA